MSSHAPGFATHVRGVLTPYAVPGGHGRCNGSDCPLHPYVCCDAMMLAARGVMGAPNGIPMTPTTYVRVCAAGRLHQQSLPEGSRLSAHTHTDGRQGALVRGGQTRTRQSLPKGIPVIHLLAQLLPAGYIHSHGLTHKHTNTEVSACMCCPNERRAFPEGIPDFQATYCSRTL